MKKKVLFIKNNLEKYKEIISTIQKISPFTVEITDFKTFKKGDMAAFINSVRLANLFLVIEEGFFQEYKEDFGDYFRNNFKSPFMNFIQVSRETDFFDLDALQDTKKYYFHFSNEIDANVQVVYFNLYVNSLFNYSETSDRLTEYITSSFQNIISEEQLKMKTEELEKLNAKLEEINKIDTLTHLYNRKTLFELLEQERKRTARDLWRVEGHNKYNQVPLGEIADHFGKYTIFMIDIDHFKGINDTYGHLVGDRVLKYLGHLLSTKGNLRTTDIAGRFGGEEFIVMLPGTNAQNSLEPARRIARDFREKEFLSDDNKPFHATLSIGISEYHSQDDKNEDIISRADQALYYSKEHGRDMITIFEKQFAQASS